MTDDNFRFDVFLSYSSHDRAVVSELAFRLRKDGLRVWFDDWEVQPGDIIPRVIESGLAYSRVLLLFMSRASLDSDWAQLESGTFRFRDPLNKDRRFIPIRLDDCDIPGTLRQILYVDWSAEKREGNYPRLLAASRPPAKLRSTKGDRVDRLSSKRISGSEMPDGATAFALDWVNDAVFVGYADGRLIRWRDGHESEILLQPSHGAGFIKRIAWNGSSRRIAIVSSRGKLRIFEVAEQGTLVATEQGGLSEVTDACWSGNGLIWCDVSGLIHRRTEAGEPIQNLAGHFGPIHVVCADNMQLLSGGHDKTIRIWSIESGRCERVLEGSTGAIRTIARNAGSFDFVSGGDDAVVRLWDGLTGECLRQFEGHTDAVLDLAWHPNGKVFLSSSRDGTVRLWSAVGGKCLRVIDGHDVDVVRVAWSSSGRSGRSFDTYGVRAFEFQQELTEPDETSRAADSARKVEQVLYTNAKVLIVGDSGAGKTGLAKRLVGKTFESSHSTVGAWATQWSLPIERDARHEREIWLWDFGGQADQRLIHQLYMDDAALIVLVFDGQKADVFETLAQWDNDLNRASTKKISKILVAGRIDAGAVRATHADISAFVLERGFYGYVETSAKTGVGCDDLELQIQKSIDWKSIPWRTSPALFKRLKDELIKLKDEGRVLMRMNELRDALRIRMSGLDVSFSDGELRAVISLLAGPGAIAELTFGSWILFQPELINAYGQAVIHTIRANPGELGCLSEARILRGDLEYHDFDRVDREDERFILLEMHRRFVEGGLCSREITENDAVLVFPSYYKRYRPALTGHPAILVGYSFDGQEDEIYSTLVVRLHYTNKMVGKELWQDAAEFATESGARVGVKLTRARQSIRPKIEVYCSETTLLADRIILTRFVHEHLIQKASNVERRRHYVCPSCLAPSLEVDVATKRRADNKKDIGCVTCDERIPLWDELELHYTDPETLKKVRRLDKAVADKLDNESKERVLVGEVMSTVALAGQISREKSVSDHGIDMEIEFKDDTQQATGELLFLQLKSGDSHLRVKADGQEVFDIKDSRHAHYWAAQKVPVFLVVRDSLGKIRWMEIRSQLRRKGKDGQPPKHIDFHGETFDVMSVRRWRKQVLGASS